MAGQMGFGQAEREQGKSPSYLGYNVLVSLVCCLPFGLVGIIYSVLTILRNNSGDLDGAKSASDMAEKWMYASCGAAFLIFAAWVIFRILGRFI